MLEWLKLLLCYIYFGTSFALEKNPFRFKFSSETSRLSQSLGMVRSWRRSEEVEKPNRQSVLVLESQQEEDELRSGKRSNEPSWQRCQNAVNGDAIRRPRRSDVVSSSSNMGSLSSSNTNKNSNYSSSNMILYFICKILFIIKQLNH